MSLETVKDESILVYQPGTCICISVYTWKYHSGKKEGHELLIPFFSKEHDVFQGAIIKSKKSQYVLQLQLYGHKQDCCHA